ncbi:hypothetical protein ABNF97_28625 [Plantactinospora sp. B6F1]|uniref:hypothetical protein n=1 Tax=Plantactinospora sp. B6F1 TaxID=3158971 RepID=UPI00102AA7E8
MTGRPVGAAATPQIRTLPDSAVEPARQLGQEAGAAHTDSADWFPADIVDEWGAQSFPASDPPANW